jgi:Sec-independent protein translocase protein TatA
MVIGQPRPTGPESLLLSLLLLVIVVVGLWFGGSILLRWAYALRQVPKQFRQGRRDVRDSADDEHDK